MSGDRRLDVVTPLGRPWRRVGDVTARLARVRPWTWPLRLAYVLVDRVAFAWWWYTEAASPNKWPGYLRLENAFCRLYWAVYCRLIVVIQREIGD